MDHHFGFIEINWQEADPSVALHIKDVTGRARVKQNVRLSRLKF
jgi:hypothetical protein